MNGVEGEAAAGLARSPEWSRVEHAHLVKEPVCIACGVQIKLQVHHIIPFHFCILLGRPELELEDGNLVTLCEGPQEHHLLIGHLDEFASANLHAREDAQSWYGKPRAFLESDPVWLAVKSSRLPTWANMTDAGKAALRALMDQRFPIPHSGLNEGVSNGSQSTTSTTGSSTEPSDRSNA